MITDLFWNIATSTLALSIDGFILFAALVVGFFPLMKFVPGIGPDVPVARLVAALVAALICFLVGFRIADERELANNLRATVAAQQADLENAAKSAADATQRASAIEKAANEQHQTDLQYIDSLQNIPACLLDDADINGMRRPAFSGRAKSPRSPSQSHGASDAAGNP